MLYPSLFILFTCIRRLDKFFLKKYFLEGIEITYTQIPAIIIPSFIISLIFLIYNIKNRIGNQKEENIIPKGIKLIQTKAHYEIPDKIYKIFILIFFAAYFEFFGFLSRRLLLLRELHDLKDENYDEFIAKLRGLEILCTSLLCYCTLRIEIYRHHIFSLIIIIFCLLANIIFEYIQNEVSIPIFLLKILNILGGSLSRAFLDTTEKYLFETDYINIFSLIFVEQFFNLIFCFLFYIPEKPRKEVKKLIHDYKNKNVMCSIILLIVYGILTCFKNIYRRFTVKQYSPMSRPFAESVIDPILIIFELLDNNKEISSSSSFIGTLISTVIIIFCCCVYNEAIILYCCNMEYFTYSEIAKRAKISTSFIKIGNISINEDDINSEKIINNEEI